MRLQIVGELLHYHHCHYLHNVGVGLLLVDSLAVVALSPHLGLPPSPLPHLLLPVVVVGPIPPLLHLRVIPIVVGSIVFPG